VRLRPVDDGAVLGHHAVEEVETGEAADQVVELAAGDEDQAAAAGPNAGQCVNRAGVDDAVVGDRAIEVDGQGEEAQHGMRQRKTHGPRC
jgi:hypothetical protein